MEFIKTDKPNNLFKTLVNKSQGRDPCLMTIPVQWGMILDMIATYDGSKVAAAGVDPMAGSDGAAMLQVSYHCIMNIYTFSCCFISMIQHRFGIYVLVRPQGKSFLLFTLSFTKLQIIPQFRTMEVPQQGVTIIFSYDGNLLYFINAGEDKIDVSLLPHVPLQLSMIVEIHTGQMQLEHLSPALMLIFSKHSTGKTNSM